MNRLLQVSGRATLLRSVGVRSFAQSARRSATTVGSSTAEKNALSEIRSFWAKNEPTPFKHVRPIAPHMTIYRLEYHFALSILHRGFLFFTAGLFTALGLGCFGVAVTGCGGGGADGKGPRAAWFQNFLNFVKWYEPNATELFVAKSALFVPFMGIAYTFTRHAIWDLGYTWTKPQLRMHNYGMTAWIGLAVAYLLYDNIVLASKYGNRLFYRLPFLSSSKPTSQWTGAGFEKTK